MGSINSVEQRPKLGGKIQGEGALAGIMYAILLDRSLRYYIDSSWEMAIR